MDPGPDDDNERHLSRVARLRSWLAGTRVHCFSRELLRPNYSLDSDANPAPPTLDPESQ